MLLLESAHPALLGAVRRMVRGDNVVPETIVRDFDGCELHVRVDAPPPPPESGPAAAAAAAAGASDAPEAAASSPTTAAATVDEEERRRLQTGVTISLKHSVDRAVLDSQGNFDSVVAAFFPAAPFNTPPGGGGGGGGGAVGAKASSGWPSAKEFAAACRVDTHPADKRFVVEVRIEPGCGSEALRETIVGRASELRVLSVVPLVKAAVAPYLAGKPEAMPSVRIPYHNSSGAGGAGGGQEAVYFYTSKGNCLCVVALRAAGRDELVLVRSFLQTFVDAKKLQKELSSAPAFAVSQGRAPPADMPSALAAQAGADGGGGEGDDGGSGGSGGGHLFWCSFQLFRHHLDSDAKLWRATQQLLNFRSNVLYHVRCCRSAMHALMRSRVESNVQIINRARTSTTGRAKVVIK